MQFNPNEMALQATDATTTLQATINLMRKGLNELSKENGDLKATIKEYESTKKIQKNEGTEKINKKKNK